MWDRRVVHEVAGGGGAFGRVLGCMLVQLSDRGPDSAGVAVYRDPAPSGSCKLTVYSADPEQRWSAFRQELGEAFGGSPEFVLRASHAVVVVGTDALTAEGWVRRQHPELHVMSAGRVIEIYKESGAPRRFVERFRFENGVGDARVRAYADGDGEPGDDGGVASVLDGARSVSGA